VIKRTGMPRYRFCEEERKSLHRLGVIDAQIEELEAILPACRAMTTDAPRLQDVRSALEGAGKAIKHAQQSIARLSRADKSAPALFEALNRVHMASYDPAAGRDGDMREIDRALDATSSLAAVVEYALERLGEKERRPNVANPMVIEHIVEALLRGWAKGPQNSSKVFTLDISRGPHPLKASRAPATRARGSAFLDVVNICYGAIGRRPEPDRAIRAYLAERAKRREHRNWAG
jgi:hypothetical protein